MIIIIISSSSSIIIIIIIIDAGCVPVDSRLSAQVVCVSVMVAPVVGTSIITIGA